MKSLLLGVTIWLATNVGYSAQLQIINEAGQPVAGASIFFGQGDTSPLVTNVNGQIEIPEKWTDRATITVIAEGFLKSTFVDLMPIDIILQIHRADNRQKMQISGLTTDFQNVRRDGKVDFSLVYPALTRRQILRFDVSTILSSEFDTIKILTEEVDIPSNLTLPNQKESYVLPITLNKPKYRMTVGQKGDYRMMATHGQFPLKKVVDDIRAGKSFYEVVNYFSFIGGGQREVTVHDDIMDQTIPVNQFSYNSAATIKAPDFGASNVMFSASMIRQGDLYFSADVKRLEPNETLQLAVPDNSKNNGFVNLLIAKSDFNSSENSEQQQDVSTSSQLTTTLQNVFTKIFNFLNLGDAETENPYKSSVSLSYIESTEVEPQFLGFTTKPIVSNDMLTFTPPTASEGIEAVATYVVLSEVEKLDKGNYNVENNYRIWELVQFGWTNQLALPTDQLILESNKIYRWEVLFLGKKSGHTQSAGDYFLDGITHVSRNSIDISQ